MSEGIKHELGEAIALRQSRSQVNRAAPRELLEPLVLTKRL